MVISAITEQLTPAEFAQFSPFDIAYAEGMMKQLGDPNRIAPTIGVDIYPTALLTAEERQAHFKVTSYKELRGNAHLLEKASEIDLIVHNLDAGLGTSVKRSSYLEELAPHLNRGPKPEIGSKATDLYEHVVTPTGETYVNVAEMKLDRVLREASQFAHVTLRPIVNHESAGPVESIYSMQTVHSRLGMEQMQTYADVIQDHSNVDIGQMVMQSALPTIDIATGQITTRKKAPGGHGQAAAQVVYEIANAESTEKPTARVIFNGDGFTNWVPAEVVADAVDNSVFTMVSTTALACDVKGGKGAVQVLPNGKKVPYLLEAAQAKAAGQEHIFYEMGMENADLPPELADKHHPGEQYFNTNSVVMVEEPLRIFLQDIKAEMGEEFFQYFVAPEFFQNPNGDVYQFDGAMGSLILRMNEIIETDERVHDIWKRSCGGRDFVRFVNIEPEYRDEFFGPIKFPIDFVEKIATDHYEFDVNEMMHKTKRPGHVTHWDGDFVQKNTFFADVSNTANALGTMAHTKELDRLFVKGAILFANAIHGGQEEIICNYVSQYEGDVFDLNSPENREKIGFNEMGQLMLANKKIIIDVQGNIQLEKLK